MAAGFPPMSARGWLLMLLLLAPAGCRDQEGRVAVLDPAAAAPGSPEVQPAAPLSPAAPVLATEARSPTSTVMPTATATPTHTPEPSPTPTATVTPEPTMPPLPTATPVPAPRQLTTGGCCWRPFFLDGQVAFIDRPAPDAPAGIYAVPLEGGTPQLVESRLGSYVAGGAFLIYQEGDITTVERRPTGERWTVDTQGQPATLSPDGDEVAWSLRDFEGAFDQRRAQLWRAPLAGAPADAEMTLLGGGLSAWLPGDRWLLTGRRSADEADRALFVLDLTTGQTFDLFRALQFRAVSVSPDGNWVVFLVAQDPTLDRNGIWLVRTDGSELRKLDWFGAYAWRGPGHLLYFPFQPEADSHEVWLYDIEAGVSRRLTDPAVTPFKIAQGDFAVAPDGRSLVYVSAHDQNLWLLQLP
ncbi:MAG TPA: hypothetical protein VER55_10480 [Ardenticatenaceae bacterium]|nr:hypothetical protein [Ardenticatenaceae bacterium]